MTLKELMSEVYSKCKDVGMLTLTPLEVIRSINIAQQNANKKLRYYLKKYTSATVVDQRTYPAPSGFIDMERCTVDKLKKEKTTVRQLDRSIGEEWIDTKGTVEYYYYDVEETVGEEIMLFPTVCLYPIPDAIQVLTFTYLCKPPDLVEEIDRPVIPAEYDEALILFAASRLAERKNLDDKGKEWLALYNSEMIQAIKERSKPLDNDLEAFESTIGDAIEFYRDNY